MSFLIVFAVFSVYSVSAASPIPVSCCLEDEQGNYCSTLEDGQGEEVCSAEYLRSGSCDLVAQCDTLGTCVPPDGGACLSDYTKYQCDSIGGQFSDLAENNVPACQLGCCADSLECGIMQQQECNGNFVGSITDQAACLLECRPKTTGCCVESNSCSFQTAEDICSGKFLPYQYCYERDFCNERYESHAYTYNGDASIIPESDIDVYWYDSNGNMEERVGDVDLRTGEIVPIPGVPEGLQLKGDCDYPDEIAFDPDGSKGGKENAYCKSTACVVECENCEPSSFKNGETICLNIFGGQYTNEKRSTALREYILSCVNGEIQEDELIEERSERICIDDSKDFNGVERMYARADIDNKWQTCLGCGEGGGILDYGGYIPGAGGLLVSLGDWCSSDNNNFLGTVPGNLGGSDECENLGNDQGVQMCYYDSDLWAPIGSCNPIYPPAISNDEQCGKCGSGGDGKVNVCTEQECNAMGDCQFEEEHAGGGLIAAGLLGVGTAVGTMAVSEGVCAAAAVFGGSPGWLGCKTGFLSGVSAAFGNLLYWGIFGLVFGLGAADQQGYEQLDKYGYSFEKENGKYDLAAMISFARAVEYALGDEESIGQGEGLGEVPEDGSIIGATSGGLVNLLAFHLSQGWSGVAAGALGQESFSEIISMFGLGDALGGAFIKAMNVVGAVISIYSVSESMNTGSCVPEIAYTNSDSCGDCGGAEGQFYCIEDRCDILGGDSGYCHFEPKLDGTDDGACLSSDPTDTTPPGISYINLQMFDQDFSLTGEQEIEGNQITTDVFSWFDAVEVKINITTDEPAKCAAAFESELNYSSMNGGELKFDGFFETDHNLVFNLTSQQKMNGENTLYIKCTDVSGAETGENDDSNWIKMLFGEEPNDVPPEIIDIDPADVLNLPFGTSEVEIKLIVEDRKDEVTECKYSVADVSNYNEEGGDVSYVANYEDLNQMFSRTGTRSCPGSSLPDDCTGFIANIVFDESESQDLDLISLGYSENGTIFPYTFGCKDSYDNPTLIEYSFSVYPGYEMDIVYPEEGMQIYDSTPEINITSEVPVYCRYKIDSAENWTDLNAGIGLEFYNNEIDDSLSASVAGVSHNLLVNCRDLGNDIVEKSVNFFVLSDAAASVITRVYTTSLFGSGKLHIELNEDAECKYDTSESDFNFEDEGTLMNAVPPTFNVDDRILSDHQTVIWDSFKYYIKCRDEWDNEGSYTIYP
ncbi:hypothetical protein HN953_01975 [Candidatus Woesearchaeota archaeon]|nr:hypothetical protein [Candidatus Woesearchaeota archaeon]